jgi:AcrR family transcriptional regulator
VRGGRIMPAKRIMDSAYELFSEGCYNCVSLSEIAKKVGIKKPSIYAHFSSKEELFLAVLDRELEKVCSYIDEELNKVIYNKAEIALYKFLKKCVEYAANNQMWRGFWRCILYSPPLTLHEQVNKRTSILDEKINNIEFQIMKQGVDRGEIKEQDMDYLIYSYTCLIKGNFDMVLRGQNYSLEMLNYCWIIYWDGIKK